MTRTCQCAWSELCIPLLYSYCKYVRLFVFSGVPVFFCIQIPTILQVLASYNIVCPVRGNRLTVYIYTNAMILWSLLSNFLRFLIFKCWTTPYSYCITLCSCRPPGMHYVFVYQGSLLLSDFFHTGCIDRVSFGQGCFQYIYYGSLKLVCRSLSHLIVK